MRALLFFLLLPATFSAQSTKADLEARLIDKPLYLRGLWAQDELHFDAAGHLNDKSAAAPFAVSGIDVKRLKLSSGKLVLEGYRMGLVFDKDGNYTRVKLYTPPPAHSEEKIQIQIAAPANSDYTAILDSIFTPDIAVLVPEMPREWQQYARKHFLGQPDPSPPPTAAPGTKRIGGAVTPPRVTFAPAPQFSPWARNAKIAGNVLVYLQVDGEGKPQHVRLLRPIGMGLDEQAMIAVYQYKFTPAMDGGNPVPVEMNVEVNFQIF